MEIKSKQRGENEEYIKSFNFEVVANVYIPIFSKKIMSRGKRK